MKTIHIRCTWVTHHEVEVPDDYEWTGNLDGAWADQVTSQIADLTDWERR